MRKIVLFNIGISGGAGKAMINLAKAFAEQGIEAHIISFKDSQYKIPKSIFFHKITSQNSPEGALKEKLDSLGEFDAIFSNSTPSNKILSKLKLTNSIHIVHSAETKNYKGFFSKIKAYLRRKKYQKLYSNKHLIAVSKGLEKFILKELKAKPKSIKTIYNPFDFNQIKKLAKEEDKDIPKEPFIVHVARYDLTSKRHDILLKAYKRANIPYKLYLIGSGEDEEKISNIIKELELEDRVILKGFLLNPYTWIKEAKLLVLSSDFEGFGLVLAEALSLGTPVVSTDAPEGPREILTRELSKFLVSTGDIKSLSKSIKSALNRYPKIDIDFSYLDAHKIVNSYINIIKRVNNENKIR